MNPPVYKRILLKLSGEILAGQKGYGIDPDILSKTCNKIIALKESGMEIGIVIGGGNIFRGISAASKGMDRVAGDYLGMLATIMNSVGLQSELEKLGWEQFLQRLLKNEISTYIEADEDVIKTKKNIVLIEEKCHYLDSIIKMISNRGFQIKSAIDWIKYKSGIV